MFPTFLDSTSFANPLPQGIFVMLTLEPAGLFVGAGFIEQGGVLPIDVTIGLTYTATFFGSAAPTETVTFIANTFQYLYTETGDKIVTDTEEGIVVSGTGPVIVPNYTTPPVIFFYDEDGVNPLPAGMQVTIFSAPNPPNQLDWELIGSSSTGLNGIVTGITLVPGQPYGANFVGAQAPAMCSANFTANTNPRLPTIVVANNYRSPCLSQTGYMQQQFNFWPRGWFSDAAMSPGGNAYNVAWSLAIALAYLDFVGQYLLSISRLQTSTGVDIDSWAFDIFGSVFQRCSSWSDATWIANIMTIFAAKKPTIAGMQTIMDLYAQCFFVLSTQKMSLDYQGALDTYGFTDFVPGSGLPPAPIGLGLDTFGGLDFAATFVDLPISGLTYQTPNVIVFDAQSNPYLAGLIGLGDAQFCIYFQYTAYSDTFITQIAPFIPQLVALINACKALGTTPIYAANLP